MEYINRIKEERSAYVQTVRYSTDSEFLIEQNPSRTDTINELIIIMVEPESSKLLPDNYAEVIYLWHSNKITAVEAMKRLGHEKDHILQTGLQAYERFQLLFRSVIIFRCRPGLPAIMKKLQQRRVSGVMTVIASGKKRIISA